MDACVTLYSMWLLATHASHPSAPIPALCAGWAEQHASQQLLARSQASPDSSLRWQRPARQSGSYFSLLLLGIVDACL